MNLKNLINNKKLYLLLLISILIIVFTYNNYFLYKTPILKIDNIELKEETNSYSDEKYYTQKITGIIKNGKYKNKKLSVLNYTSTSGVYDEQIHKNSELFVEVANGGDKILSISGIKRDKYIVILLVLFIDLMIIVGKKKGAKTILSLLINIILSFFVLYIYNNVFKNVSILLLFIPISVLFIIISLYITNGKSKKTLAAIISAAMSLILSFTLAYVLMRTYSESIPYWFVDYIEALKDYENLFYVNILLCGLGAIMDIAITMSSSLNELIEKNSSIKLEDLIKSGKEIAKDIVGTMTNVMLFTVYSSIIPISLLAIRNNMPMSMVINTYGQVEMIRVLTSSISIVLAIPISLYISAFLLKGIKGDRK